GGLGDVLYALPKYLAKSKHQIAVVLPYYKSIKNENHEDIEYVASTMVELAWRRQYCGIYTVVREGVRYFLLDNEFYFNRPTAYGQYDDGERFAFFSKAVLAMLPFVNFYPDVIHANDWQTALVPLFLDAFYKEIPEYSNIKTVFTIHNIEYQGFCQLSFLSEVCGVPDRYYAKYEYAGCINLMKGALEMADAITTVSPTYAEELSYSFYGHGLENIIRANAHKLTGILNGIDVSSYNPWTDKNIPFRFSRNQRGGKAKCKAALQAELGLEQNPDAMLIGMVTRLVSHKGLDLVRAVFNDLMRANVQFVVLGLGDAQYEEFFQTAELHYPGRVKAMLAFDAPLSHRIYAGCDLFLMPSKAEPCGLAQMISMRYGTLPLVRETGGLKDTVSPVDDEGNGGRGFTFHSYNAHDMLDSLWRACGLYGKPEKWAQIMTAAMTYPCGWDQSADRYLDLYNKLV
ncbi:MAG: glycogen synthase, partial [Clostridia bacterium]|nr:glycogen synthase [Clostridia bacterium]